MDEQSDPNITNNTAGGPPPSPGPAPEPVAAPVTPPVDPEPVIQPQAVPAPPTPEQIAQPQVVSTPNIDAVSSEPANIQAPAGQVFGPGSADAPQQPAQPVAQPTPVSPTPTTNAPIGDISPLESPKWYQKLKVPTVLIIAIAAILLIGGGGAFAYMGYILPNQPKNVVKAVLGNMIDPKTPQTYTLKTEISTTGDSTVATGKVLVDAVSGADKDGNTRIDISTEFSAFKISGSIIARITDKELYIKVDQLPSLLSLASGGQSSPQLQQLSRTIGDKWLRFSASDLKDAGIIDATTADKADQCIEAYASYVKTSQADITKQLSSTYDKQNFVIITKVGQESINGQKMTKYKLSIDQDKLKTFAEGLGKQFEGPTKDLAQKCGFSDTSSITDKATNSSDTSNVKASDAYLWVNSKKQLVKLTLTISDQTTKMAMTLTSESKQADTAKPTSVVTIKELNLDQLINSFTGSFSGGF